MKRITTRLTIPLTDRPPVSIDREQWPVLAKAHQANRRWSVWLKVRRHVDGRAIVYGWSCYDSDYRGESGYDYRGGEVLRSAVRSRQEMRR